MNGRIREVRKALHLTQTQFANRIGLKQSYITQAETGVKGVSNQTILSICREFHVSEAWLRTGEGEMFADSRSEDAISQFLDNVSRSEPNDIRRRLVSVLARLSDDQWTMLAQIADDLVAESAKRQEQDAEARWKREIDEKVAAYRQELEREKRRELSLSKGTESSTA